MASEKLPLSYKGHPLRRKEEFHGIRKAPSFL